MSNMADQILEWNEQMITREAVLQNVSESKKINITLEMVSESKAKAKEALYQLILTEAIGEDETDDMTDENTKPVHDDWLWRNELRTEQRQTLAKLFNK